MKCLKKYSKYFSNEIMNTLATRIAANENYNYLANKFDSLE